MNNDSNCSRSVRSSSNHIWKECAGPGLGYWRCGISYGWNLMTCGSRYRNLAPPYASVRDAAGTLPGLRRAANRMEVTCIGLTLYLFGSAWAPQVQLSSVEHPQYCEVSGPNMMWNPYPEGFWWYLEHPFPYQHPQSVSKSYSPGYLNQLRNPIQDWSEANDLWWRHMPFFVFLCPLG